MLGEQEWIKENGPIPDGKVLVTKSSGMNFLLGKHECHLEDTIQPTTLVGFFGRLIFLGLVVAGVTTVCLLV